MPQSEDRKTFDDISSCDLIIMIQGHYLCDLWGGIRGLLNAFVVLYPLILAKVFHRQIILLGVSTGPFKGKFSQWLVKKTLNKAHIYVRDAYSKEYIITAGADPSRVSLIPDLGCLFFSSDKNPALVPSVKVPYDASRCNIGMILATESSDASSSYIKSMAALCDYLVETKGAHITLIPNTSDVFPDDDIITLGKLRGLMKWKEKARVLPYEANPEHFVSIFNSLDLVITSRFHGVILSRPTPVIAIPVAFMPYRIISLMETLGIAEYICYLNSTSSFDEAKNMVDKAWAHREEIRAQQQRVIADIPRQLELAVEKLEGIVNKKQEIP